MAETAQSKTGAAHGETIHLPAPTAWPIVLAFGCTMAAGAGDEPVGDGLRSGADGGRVRWVVPAGAAA